MIRSRILFAMLVLILLPNAAASDNALLDVDAVDTQLTVLLRSLAVQSGENIVIGKDVDAKVTAQLKQLPLPDILSHLTSTNGLTWKKQDGAYVVTTAAPVATEVLEPELVSSIYQCRYKNARELADVVAGLYPDVTAVVGPTSASPTLDSSAAAATGSAVAQVEDTATQSNGLAPGTLVLRGPQAQVAEVLTTLRGLDRRPPQVTIEVLVTELSDNATRELGLSWSWSNITFQESGPPAGVRFGTFTRQGLSVEAVLDALDEQGNARLLARPSLSVVDGGRGSILIGDRLLFPKLIGYSQFGTPIYDKEEEKVGIYLQIAPVISDDGYITMTVYPQVSVVTGFLRTQAGDYPQISTRETRTTVWMKSGERLAIGGLIRDDEIDTMSKVPLLGDLPFIKNLFRHRSTVTNRSEIVILITPTIIGGEAEPEQ